MRNCVFDSKRFVEIYGKMAVSHELNHVYILGFFQDILENDDIQLDSMFIASIVFDIIRVRSYLYSIQNVLFPTVNVFDPTKLIKRNI